MYTYDQAPSGFTENVVMINLTKNLWSLTWWSVVGCLQVQGQALENGGWETTCWGCRLRLLLPVFAPIFKCGWCGAITIYKPPARPRSQCSPALEIARDRVLVVAVLLFIVSIVCEHPKLDLKPSSPWNWSSCSCKSFSSKQHGIWFWKVWLNNIHLQMEECGLYFLFCSPKYRWDFSLILLSRHSSPSTPS